MTEYLILPITSYDSFNYFYTLTVAFGVCYVPIGWVFKVISRS